jgi:hypothetical protein
MMDDQRTQLKERIKTLEDPLKLEEKLLHSDIWAHVLEKTVLDTEWPSDTTTSCASTTYTLKSDIIEAWKRRKKKNHRKEAWKRHKKRRHLKLDRQKLVPHRLKLAPPAKVGLNIGYSRSAQVNSVLAMKPPMSSISLVTKLPLARGCLYIWVTLLLPKIEMN